MTGTKAETGVLVGRMIGLHQDRAFTVQGMWTGIDAKKKAEATCKDEHFFCLKVPLNKELKLADIPWKETWRPAMDKNKE